MAFFGFRVRRYARDAETDRRRTERLLRLANEIAEEITNERHGLERRYRAASTDAGFAVEAMGNEMVGTSDRVQELSATILSCEKRLSQLALQLRELDDIKTSIEGFGQSSVNIQRATG